MTTLKQRVKRITKSSKWTIVIDDGFVSYEFNPKLRGDFNIQEVAHMTQLAMDIFQEDDTLKKALEEKREENKMVT